ncbi:MAG TPA: hypothetical protein VLA93_08370 [Pyrinomonadaceae bacterium]|nr:hypothetical protein [Pyrinomonadaceae bacterium]
MQLVATGGELTTPQAPKKPERSSTMRGVRLGTWIILASFVFTLFVGFLSAIDDDFAILLLGSAAAFLVGLVRLLYAVFVQDRRDHRQKELETNVVAAILGHAVPNVRYQLGQSPGQPVDTFTRPIKTTAEVVQPPSVTENTTRLLDDEAESHRK